MERLCHTATPAPDDPRRGTRELHLPETMWRHIEQADRLLEIGCGYGHVLALLSRRCRGFVFGTDRDPSRLQAVRRNYPAQVVFAADSEGALPLAAGSIDLVLSSDTIEHLPDPSRHIEQVRRVLRPGGLYLIKTPNALFDTPYWLLHDTGEALRGLGLRALWRWPRVMREANVALRQPGRHCCTHTPGSLRRLLQRGGFRCLRVVKQPPSTTQQQKMARLPALLRGLLVPFVWMLPVLPYTLQWSIMGIFVKEDTP